MMTECACGGFRPTVGELYGSSVEVRGDRLSVVRGGWRYELRDCACGGFIVAEIVPPAFVVGGAL